MLETLFSLVQNLIVLLLADSLQWWWLSEGYNKYTYICFRLVDQADTTTSSNNTKRERERMNGQRPDIVSRFFLPYVHCCTKSMYIVYTCTAAQQNS